MPRKSPPAIKPRGLFRLWSMWAKALVTDTFPVETASLTPCLGVRLFFFLVDSPALLPLFVRTVISRHLRPSGDPPGGTRGVLSPSVALSGALGPAAPMGEQLFSFPRISGAGQGEDWQGWKRGGGEKAGREGRGASRVQRREAQAWTH